MIIPGSGPDPNRNRHQAAIKPAAEVNGLHCYHCVMKVAGFVLAGGRSVRMGRDKALLPFAGATLIEHVAGQVREAAGSATIVGHPERYRSLGLPAIGEDFAGCGPLSGVEAALRAAHGGWAAITACDMPGVTASWLRALIASAMEGRVQAAVTLSASGRPEPLCAVYHSSLQADARQALERGEFAVWKLLKKWEIKLLPVPEAQLPANVNTPEEWVAWSR